MDRVCGNLALECAEEGRGDEEEAVRIEGARALLSDVRL
jgi:hypothetical protein